MSATRLIAAAASAGLLLSSSRPASADPAERPEPAACDKVGPRNAISTQPFAFFARGVALSYERLLAPRVSAAALAGYRSAAQGDYASSTIHGGLEGRVWIRPSADIRCDTIAMSGPFLGLRLGVGYTRLVERMDDRSVGSSVALSPTLQGGWRFVAWRLVEVTPSIGLGVRADLDPPAGLVSQPRGVVAFNLSVGWMF